MKNKSIIIYKDLYEATRRPLKWGEMVFESYWKRDSAGNIQQSEPTTSEFLSGFWFPAAPSLDGFNVMLENVWTGFKIETLTDSHGVTIERVVFKPMGSPGDINGAFILSFQKNFKAND